MIEDNQSHSHLIRTLLAETKIGVEVEEVADGHSALKRIVQANFDCIFLDYLLPDIPGMEMIKKVKAIKPNLPVISITGFRNAKLDQEMMGLGVHRIISKDKISKEELINVLQSIHQPEEGMPATKPDIGAGVTEEQLEENQYLVLYIEDDLSNVELVRQSLMIRKDVEFIFAQEAYSGIELAKTHHPDLVLMDINLPGMDGVEAMQLLRKNKETKDIPIMALSAHPQEMDVEAGQAAGFDEYMIKPILIPQFLEKVDDLLKKQGR